MGKYRTYWVMYRGNIDVPEDAGPVGPVGPVCVVAKFPVFSAGEQSKMHASKSQVPWVTVHHLGH